MPEIADFVNRGASLITPQIVEGILRKLPMWKAEFTQINSTKYTHLVDQLEFLVDAVEDTADGAYKELPYHAFAGAVFAVMYAHKKTDLIPDHKGDIGLADDSGVVRAVLIQHEKAFAKYALTQGIPWNRITSKP